MLTRLFSGLLTAVVLSAVWAAETAALAGTYRIGSDVSGGVLNMRDGPGIGHRLVIGIPAGTGGLTVEGCQPSDDGQTHDQWCRTSWGALSGQRQGRNLISRQRE